MLTHPERLADCDPDLITLWTSIGQDRDVVIIQGARTVAEEQSAIAAGRSSLKNPLDSKHVTDPTLRPLALAVDAAPMPLDWTDLPGFQALGTFVEQRAAELGIALTWGGRWIHLRDMDHFELVHAHEETT
jgi:hypothetical protein